MLNLLAWLAAGMSGAIGLYLLWCLLGIAWEVAKVIPGLIALLLRQ